MAVDDSDNFALVFCFGVVRWIKDEVLVWRFSDIAAREITAATFDNSNQTAGFTRKLRLGVFQDLLLQRRCQLHWVKPTPGNDPNGKPTSVRKVYSLFGVVNV